MKDAQFADMVWGIVPHYMLSDEPRHKQHEAMAYVMGVRQFPERVIRFLSQVWSMT